MHHGLITEESTANVLCYIFQQMTNSPSAGLFGKWNRQIFCTADLAIGMHKGPQTVPFKRQVERDRQLPEILLSDKYCASVISLKDAISLSRFKYGRIVAIMQL